MTCVRFAVLCSYVFLLLKMCLQGFRDKMAPLNVTITILEPFDKNLSVGSFTKYVDSKGERAVHEMSMLLNKFGKLY